MLEIRELKSILALEEKSAACNRLLCFASEMKDGFFPWVQEVAQLMQPLMEYSCHDGVRIAAISIVPHLINCAKIYSEKNPGGGNYVGELFAFLFPPLMKSVREEDDTEVLVFGIESLSKTLYFMGANSLSQDQINSVVHDTCLLISASSLRRKELENQNPDKDSEASLRAKDEMAEEDEVSSELAEIIGSLVTFHPQQFLNAFAELAPICGKLVQPTMSPAERQLALCIFDDVVEHGKQLSFPLWEHFMPYMIQYSQDAHPGVRQAACYGLGVCAQFGEDVFKPMFRTVLEALLTTINKPGSREDDRVAPPTENAISSIGKMIAYQSQCFVGNELQEIVNVWISWLPIEFDELEAKAVHGHFCNLIASQGGLMLGPNSCNLPKILTILAQILADPDLIEDVNIAKNLLLSFQAQIPAELLKSAFLVLPQEHQETLQIVMNK